jgi:pre-mRNA-splicing factor SYF1
MISTHPAEIKSIDCEKIIRYGLRKYTDEVGNLWISLVEYNIR